MLYDFLHLIEIFYWAFFCENTDFRNIFHTGLDTWIIGRWHGQAWTPDEDTAGISGRQCYIFSLRHGCSSNFKTSLLSFYTIWTDRDCRQNGNSEGGGLQSLLTADGVILDMALRRSFSTPQILNCWLWVSVYVVYREFTCVSHQLSCCQATKTTPVPTDGNLWRFLLHLPLWISFCTCLSADFYLYVYYLSLTTAYIL